ncbi:MAG: AraC family transcriptional regulator, partial [Spirochaetota bacterium]|nr:AraC family transcriptional regulator [Spirochaetota bacterium]
VQLNHNKLKYGFKQVFNNTIFGYLKEIRLEQARTLLLDERLSVTETAYTVGYNSLSHFAAAFHQKYGMNPGSIRK